MGTKSGIVHKPDSCRRSSGFESYEDTICWEKKHIFWWHTNLQLVSQALDVSEK